MSVNKIILIGNIGKDPEVRHLDSGNVVANLTLATSERGYTTKSGQEVPERTEWHNIVVWNGLAKVVESYVKKGTQLYIEGKIRTRSYDDKDGNKRYITEIFADNLQLLGSKSERSATANQYNQSCNHETANQDLSSGSSDDLPFN